ncbi:MULTISPECIES: glycosyltransferase [unclassified Duganella]|uniref:glycosyltransferase n=1 Tax=unclassified Duganella TaxID=2636909 RepID=UPI00088CBEFE|nr:MULTISPECIES: glycosyltransferase [unclassified Duganella]SDF93260.1 Glycosyltransferase involved in cell wall bisynthesis [Duganella sp. OV458]SDJ11615.1 Glycosyltransferase involved in cell wall bisynthesis [Duganella sp. OV510]
MRIVIDLQASQNGAAADPAAVVALAQAVVRAATSHTIILLMHARYGASIDALRLAFGPLLPAEQLCIFEAPAGHSVWSQRAADALRDTLLADLRADLVWTPGVFDCGAAALLPTVTGCSAPAVYTVASAAALAAPPASDAPATAAFYRQQQALRQAQLLTAADAATAEALRAAAPGVKVVQAATAEALLQAFAAVPAASVTAPPGKPRLAYLSPLPPQQSGIADYSVELVAQLEQFYDIELIVEQPDACAPHLQACYTLRDVAWFEAHAQQYQRVLYHFGNNGVHQHMFELLRRYPGVVVLHDFFLSGVLDNMERDGYLPQAFLNALYESHGYTGLQTHQRQGRNPSIWQFPCNKGVLDHATGVIVHSEFSRRLAQQWYGSDTDVLWRSVPLIRGLPAGHQPAQARQQARADLALADDSFMICSFGMMGVTKLNDVLLEAFLASPLAADPRCQLVFVGAADPGLYGREIGRSIAASAVAGRVHITGFVSTEQYATYLAAADAAVQLRSKTRGETSASVLDCLLYGLPTVVNAHGSSADLPDSVLVKLDDECSSAALGAALTRLHGDAAGRQALAARARAYLQAHHAPQQVGPRFRDAIEQLTAASPLNHYATLVEALRRLPPPGETELMDAAEAIAANRLPSAPRQMFVDISALVQADLKTGIQRVVRSILLGLIETPPPGYRIEPVYSDGGNRPYRYARRYTLDLLGCPPMALEDAPLEVRTGDMFLGLDLFTNGTAQNHARLLDMRRRGVQMYFVVYDLLPVLRPDVFPLGAQGYFADYLDTIGAVSDGLLCISRAVADELHDWLATRPNRSRRDPLQLAYFHLGADIDASAPSFGLPDNAAQVLAHIAARPSLLMVGTIEPRKGQAQAVEAFNLLWQQGVDANLVIVGKQGWMMDALAEQLRQHPESQQRLFWLAGVSDEMLLKLYQSCSALLAASIGEGFGLPLIEAAQHGLPIIARDLPVFREVGGQHAYYFDAADAAALAATLKDWLALHAAGEAPQSAGMPWLTWKDSTQQLLQAVTQQRWYRHLAPATTGTV